MNFFSKAEFLSFCLIFSLIFMLKLDDPFRNKEFFIKLSFFNNSDLGFKRKDYFFVVFG